MLSVDQMQPTMMTEFWRLEFSYSEISFLPLRSRLQDEGKRMRATRAIKVNDAWKDNGSESLHWLGCERTNKGSRGDVREKGFLLAKKTTFTNRK